MIRIILSIIISLLWSLPVSAFVINDKVYLNACGSNPQEYKTDPLNVNNIIIEVPNKIISLEKSKYDRPIQTLATSSFCPTLLIGIFCEAACEAVSFDIIGDASFVSVNPGATALILSPRFA